MNVDRFSQIQKTGSHGPAYYKRYPKAFEKFTPVCKTNQLNDCSDLEINNAYDNTILYTDFVLSKTIEVLKKNKNSENALFYISDHGESLGENGLYLHGMPNFIAPKEQTKVPAILWFNKLFIEKIDLIKLKIDLSNKLSHDNLFHTLLNLMDPSTTIKNLT